MTQEYTPGPFKIWHSGYAEAPAIIYTGDIPPYLGKSGKLVMAPGSYIAEVSTQRGHMMPNEDYIQEDNASLFAAAPETAAERDELKIQLAARTKDRDNLRKESAENNNHAVKAHDLNAELVEALTDLAASIGKMRPMSQQEGYGDLVANLCEAKSVLAKVQKEG